MRLPNPHSKHTLFTKIQQNPFFQGPTSDFPHISGPLSLRFPIEGQLYSSSCLIFDSLFSHTVLVMGETVSSPKFIGSGPNPQYLRI